MLRGIHLSEGSKLDFDVNSNRGVVVVLFRKKYRNFIILLKRDDAESKQDL